MATEVNTVVVWTFVQEIPIPQDVNDILLPEEKAVKAYKTYRDSAIFTDKRLIVRDAQGLTGKKIEMYSLPWSNVNMWSSENAGKLLDFNSEIELWTRAGHIKIKIDKKANIREIDKLIAQSTLANK